MKLREFNFNNINERVLSVMDGKTDVVWDFIGEALKKIPHLADREIESTNVFFDTFVIRLKKEE